MAKLPYGRLIQRRGVSPNWYWQYWDSQQKRNRTESMGTARRSEAEQRAATRATEYLAERAGLIQGTPLGGITIQYAAYEWIKSRVNERGVSSESHLYNLSIYIDKFILPYFGSDMPLTKIRAPQIKAFRDWICEAGYSANYTNRIISGLCGIFKFAEMQDWIDRQPTFSRARVEQREHGYALSDEQIRALLDAAAAINHYVLRWVALGVFCGMRLSESLGAHWEWIDWDYGSDFNPAWRVPGVLRLPRQKNRSGMLIALGAARRVLEAVPAGERAGHIVMYLHPSGGLPPRPAQRMGKTWQRLLRAAGLDEIVKPDGRGLGFHDLRHTYVTRQFRLMGYEARNLSRHSSQEAFIRYLHSERNDALGAAGDAFESLRDWGRPEAGVGDNAGK